MYTMPLYCTGALYTFGYTVSRGQSQEPVCREPSYSPADQYFELDITGCDAACVVGKDKCGFGRVVVQPSTRVQ